MTIKSHRNRGTIMDENEKDFNCRMHEYKLQTLGACIDDMKQDMKNLDAKVDARFDKLTDLILGNTYQNQNVAEQKKNTKSANKSNVWSAAIGGVIGFIASVILALLHIV